MLKRSRGLIALVAIMALVAAACGDGSSSDGNTICQVTDVGGIDDKGFNASAWEGAQRTDDLGWDSQFLESQAETDYAVNIDSFVDEGCELGHHHRLLAR